MWAEETRGTTFARGGSAGYVRHASGALRRMPGTDDREMTAAFKAIDLENDGITRMAPYVDLWLGAG